MARWLDGSMAQQIFPTHAGVAYMDQKHGSTRTYKYVGQVTHNANAFA